MVCHGASRHGILGELWGRRASTDPSDAAREGLRSRAEGVATEENFVTAGDLVAFIVDPGVYQQPDAAQLYLLTQPQALNLDGTILVPYIGPVSVLGLTERELSSLVRNLLSPLFAFELDIQARIRDSGKKFYVFGEMSLRGPVPLRNGDLTLIEAVSSVGWTPLANLGRVQLIRPDAENPLVVTINFWEMIWTGDTTYNLRIQNNDFIYMPPTVLGAISRFIERILAPLNAVVQSLLAWRRCDRATTSSPANRKTCPSSSASNVAARGPRGIPVALRRPRQEATLAGDPSVPCGAAGGGSRCLPNSALLRGGHGADVQRQRVGPQHRSNRDPLAAVVGNAPITLPHTVEKTLLATGWPLPARGTDEWATYVEDVRDRLTVVLSSPTENRQSAHISVVYRDTRGQRSAEFLNRLCAMWMADRMDEIRDKSAIEQRNVREKIVGRRAVERAVGATWRLPNEARVWIRRISSKTSSVVV